MATRMEQLLRQRDQLLERIEQQASRDKQRQDGEDLRRKILIGECVMQQHEAAGAPERLGQLMDSFLKSKKDRALFRLPPLQSAPEE